MEAKQYRPRAEIIRLQRMRRALEDEGFIAARRDAYSGIAQAVNKATGTNAPRGEELLPPELAKKYSKARERRLVHTH